MPFITDGRTLIRDALAGRYAMPAFNVSSLEMGRACIEAAEAEKAPVILQTYPGDLDQATPHVFAAMVRALAEEASVPVMLHLDHGDGLERATACLRAGYSSVMFDGDELPLAENVARSRTIATVAHAAGASMEVAAGGFGAGEGDGGVHLTEPDAAVTLMRETGADMVACSVGSRHGQPSKLDLGRLEAIAEAVRGPLVLHGGSGIPADDLARATELGVVKVNIGAALFRATVSAWREAAPGAQVHYEVLPVVRDALRRVAREKIRLMRVHARA
ncbi:MAG TPA: class II fructose-bisphosphate aldolase [Trueperaceae bacterium]|nr:class II fructose-bisphosphate aldolase [Trueperaceae bacterium]